MGARTGARANGNFLGRFALKVKVFLIQLESIALLLLISSVDAIEATEAPASLFPAIGPNQALAERAKT